MRETITMQCYPSDSAINEMTALYNDFGWELIGNQRCKELDSRTDNYEYYNTFNKLTFTREKSSPWYEKVVKLEEEYKAAKARYNYLKAPEKPEFNPACLALFVLWIIPGIVYCVSYSKKKKKYEKEYADWEKNSRAVQAKCGAQMQELREQARALVNA